MYWTVSVGGIARDIGVFMPDHLGTTATGLNGITLNKTNGSYATSAVAPTNNTVGLGDATPSNHIDSSYIAYLWRAIPGYSAFGQVEGNGDPDGMFAYTGFRPAFLLYKNSSDTSDWCLVDTTTGGPTNPVPVSYHPTRDLGELPAATTFDVDLVSNGFKIRGTNNNMNKVGSTFIYAAFAENPFGGSNVSPANAR